MGFNIITTLAAISLLSLTSARVITQSAIASILQDIMSPSNTDKAMQLVGMMASRANQNVAIPNTPRAVFASSDCGCPAGTVIANELPVRAIIARNEMPLPARRIIANDGMARIISGEGACGPEIVYSQAPQQNMVRQLVRECPASIIELPREIYQATPVALPQENIVYPYRPPTSAPNMPCGCPSPNPYLPIASTAPNPYLPVASTAPNPYLPVASTAPNPYLPVASTANPYLPLASSPYQPCGAPNPFLPVASPISAMSPSLMPPPTQSKGQFLKKIPFPPPTL